MAWTYMTVNLAVGQGNRRNMDIEDVVINLKMVSWYPEVVGTVFWRRSFGGSELARLREAWGWVLS